MQSKNLPTRIRCPTYEDSKKREKWTIVKPQVMKHNIEVRKYVDMKT